MAREAWNLEAGPAASGNGRFEQALGLLIRLAGGELDARAELSEANDELDGLLAGLNMLAEELEASTVELRQAHDQLEIRVRERTEELAEKTSLLESILANMGDGVVVTDEAGNVLLSNPASARIVGVEEPSAPVGEWIDAYHIRDAADSGPFPNERLPMMRALRGEAADQVEMLVRTPGRNDRTYISVTARPLRDEGGRIHGSISVLRDITDHKRAEAEAREANRRLEKLASNLERDAHSFRLLGEFGGMLQAAVTNEELYDIVDTYAIRLFPDSIGGLYLYSPSRDDLELATEWGGFDPEDEERVFKPDACWGLRRGRIHFNAPNSEGMTCRHVVSPETCDALCAPVMGLGEVIGLLHIRCIAHEEASAGEAEHQRTEESERVAGSVAEYLGLALANIRLREALRQQSIRDPLTGLFNRRYLEEALNREILRAVRLESPIAVMMLDIDHFKRFNDSHGHEAGDVMLQAFGEFLQASARGGDIACRYGGEEFTLILTDTPLESAARRAEELCAGVKRVRASLAAQEFGPITVSIGLASYPTHGANRDELLAAADAALYEAKTAGRDRVVISGKPAGDSD